MEQINRIELLGVVGSVRFQNVGDRTMDKFTLVTNRAYKNKEGAPVIETTWHNVTAFEGRQVNNLASIAKGIPIHVWGRLQIQHYTGADGSDRISTDVLCNRLEFPPQNEELQYEL